MNILSQQIERGILEAMVILVLLLLYQGDWDIRREVYISWYENILISSVEAIYTQVINTNTQKVKCKSMLHKWTMIIHIVIS